jgi:hypothetical protein
MRREVCAEGIHRRGWEVANKEIKGMREIDVLFAVWGKVDGMLADVFYLIGEELGSQDFRGGGRSVTVFGEQSVGMIGLVWWEDGRESLEA